MIDNIYIYLNFLNKVILINKYDVQNIYMIKKIIYKIHI